MTALRFSVNSSNYMKQKLEEDYKRARKAASLAIESTTRYGRTLAKKEILKQVDLPASYLDGSSSEGRRLDVQFTRYTTDNAVAEGRIIGRRRATSLARYGAVQLYVPGKRKGKRKAGVTVKVRGRRKTISRAFLMNLKSGKSNNGNVGLVIRTPKGEKPHRRFNGKPLYKNSDQESDLYLLYGPSIDQVFDDVAPAITPELSKYLNREFVRQYTR